MHEIVVFALPVFALCIALEFGYGHAKGRNTYRLNDAIASLSQGLLSQVVAACTQLFQVGLYAAAYPHVGPLGWFDRVFSSPSNHRVHHAVNDACLDRNYGAVLVLWDRLFGSFRAETEPCVYGTRTPLNSWDPLWATAQGYRALWERMRRTPRWADKLRVLVKPPGWLPPGLHEQAPDDAGMSAGTGAGMTTGIAQAVFDPPMRPAQRAVAVAGFLVVLAAGTTFLWRADGLDAWRSAAAALGVAGGLWSIGAVMSGRLRTTTAAASITSCAAGALAACGALPSLPIA